MRTVQAALAWNTAIDALAVLAGKPCDAIAGVVAASIGAKATSGASLTDGDFWVSAVADVGGVSAIVILLAGACTRHLTARELDADTRVAVLTAGRDANFTPKRAVTIAKGIEPGAGRAKGLHLAPGPDEPAAALTTAALTTAAVATTLPACTVRIDGGIASRVGRKRGGNRFSTAGQGRSGQHNVSKGAHGFGGDGDGPPRMKG